MADLVLTPEPPEGLREAALRGNLVLFIGAGASRVAGCPGWDEFANGALLVSYFVQKFAKEMQKKIGTIPTATMKGLAAWEWLGNIRELENFIERAVILTRGES